MRQFRVGRLSMRGVIRTCPSDRPYVRPWAFHRLATVCPPPSNPPRALHLHPLNAITAIFRSRFSWASFLIQRFFRTELYEVRM